MREPMSILVDRTEAGLFRATSPEAPGLSAEAMTIAELFSALALQVEPFFTSVEDTEVEDDAGFESDLEYLLDKNAELYRRLAK